MLCVACGNRLGDGARFCSFCGAPPTAVEPQPLSTAAPSAPEPDKKRRSLFGRRGSSAEPTASSPALAFDIYIEEAEWETDGYDGALFWRGLGIRDTDDEILRYDDLNEEATPALVVSAAGAAEYHTKALRQPAFEPGSGILLVLDRRNQYDRHAVAMLDTTGEHHVGYVPKAFSERVARWIEADDARALVLMEIRQGRKRTGLKVLIWRPSSVRVLARG